MDEHTIAMAEIKMQEHMMAMAEMMKGEGLTAEAMTVAAAMMAHPALGHLANLKETCKVK